MGRITDSGELLTYCQNYDFKRDEDKFNININMMERFQEQLSMRGLSVLLEESYVPKLNRKSPPVRKEYKAYNTGSDYVVTVSSMSEYIQEINAISSFLKPKYQEGIPRANYLWYRGHSDKNHILLPGLLRAWKAKQRRSPIEYEMALMDIFSSRTSHVMETDTHLVRNAFDWLVHMQHYGMPTNLLDWSENAFVALFFALVKKDDSITAKDAAVYVMNPEYMELVREVLVKNAPLEKLHKRLYPIANFSTGHFDNDDMAFMPARDQVSRWWNDDASKRPEWWPKPVVSSLSNVRIRAQYGAFTVNNLMAKPNFGGGEGGYDYLSIEHMQKEFLEKYPSENPFLYKVIIKKDCIGEMVDNLRSAGYKTMNVYPEIENISQAIKTQVDTYFNSYI